MADQHMKRCSASLIVGETQVKATVRCHSRLPGRPSPGGQQAGAGEGVGYRGTAGTAGGAVNPGTYCGNHRSACPDHPALPSHPLAAPAPQETPHCAGSLSTAPQLYRLT